MHKFKIAIIAFSISIIFICAPALSQTERLYSAQMREEMVYRQVEARGIKDERILEAMRKIERHKFVPKHLQALAYIDRPLPIGEDQTISQPYIVALMTNVLELKGDEKVLEIGTGSGYQAAILAELAREVYTIEINPRLAKVAKKRLKDLGYKNIKVKTGDGYLGWPEYAPFDAIIVTCAPDEVPERLVEQLSEGGRMVLPLAGAYPQKLIRVEKKQGQITQKYITDVMFVPMVHGE